jgi:hypothetical protein
LTDERRTLPGRLDEHESVRGSRYTSIDYTQTLADHSVLASVGSVGDAYDRSRRRDGVPAMREHYAGQSAAARRALVTGTS